MRLWHEDLLPLLPDNQLKGQHRECCALRGKGWGKKHSTIDYVFKYPYEFLFLYHLQVMKEMKRRGYNIGGLWLVPCYRGKKLGICADATTPEGFYQAFNRRELGVNIYPDHDDDYLTECLTNLKDKGIIIEFAEGDNEKL